MRYVYWTTELKGGWRCVPDTARERIAAVKNDAMFFTWASLSQPYDDNGNEPQRWGDFPLDFDDGDNPEAALDDLKALCLIHLPETYDIDPYAIRFYASGSKGFHAILPAPLFGAEDGHPLLPLIYKQMARQWVRDFDLKTLDLSLYSMKRGKMFRVANVKRSNGRYKVPVTLEELQGLSIDELLKFTHGKREVDHPDGPNLDRSAPLHELFLKYSDDESLKTHQQHAPLADDVLEKIKTEIPPCLNYIIKNRPPKTDDCNFNQMTMLLINYFQTVGYKKSDAWRQMRDFIHGYQDSESYNTVDKRIEHFNDQWEYHHNNDYVFHCRIVQGLRLDRKAYPCDACIGHDETLLEAAVDITAAVETDKTEQTAIGFPTQVMTGAAGFFANIYGEVMEAPQSFLFMSYLTCLGALISPFVSISSVLETQPRLYTLLIGRSNVERKSTSIKAAVKLFKGCARSFKYHHGVGSDMGLARLLNELEDEDDDQIISASVGTLLVFDEFRAFINKCNIQSQVLLQCVTTLFENNEFENATKHKHVLIPDAYLSILAATTDDTYARIYNNDFLDIGFPNRVFIVPDLAQRRFSIPEDIAPQDTVTLNHHLEQITNLIAGGMKLKIIDAAYRFYDDWYHNIPDSIYAYRMETYSLRLAMLLAVNELKGAIDRETIENACGLCDWQIKVRYEYDQVGAGDQITEMEERIRRVLKKGPGTLRQIRQAINPYRTGKPISLWAFNKARENLKSAEEMKFNTKTKLWELVGEG
jgi:hypothetical protein